MQPREHNNGMRAWKGNVFIDFYFMNWSLHKNGLGLFYSVRLWNWGIEGRIVKTHPLSQSFNHPDELIHREWIEFSAIALASKAC